MARTYTLKPFQPSTELRIDYANELNEQQHAAVTAGPGSSLVIAGAGSGKTRTLTYRVAYLLEQGVPASRILLLTFTNKAAREMMSRVDQLLGRELSDLWGGTFHSIGNRILRRHADLLGYQRDFTILDREDSKDLLKTCIGALDIDTKKTRFPKPEVLSNIFSLATNMQTRVAEIVGQSYEHFSQLTPVIEKLAAAYRNCKRKANVMDFDDLLLLWLSLLRDHPDLRERYQQRFQYLLVDEYQDTNELQSEVIDLLAEKHHNLMVVGDDSQSIYSWRGANYENILQFPEKYPEAQTYKIEVNYRSTPEILAVANAAIAANVNQFEKVLTAANKPGPKPALVTCSDSSEQAAFVAQRVLELRDEGTDMNRMAVLYRSHFHALELQLELTKRNIPFAITSGIRFFEQAHVKDVAAHLRFVCNPLDEVCFKRMVQLLRGIGAKGADKLWHAFLENLPPLPEPPPEPAAEASATPPRGPEDEDPDWSVDDETEAAARAELPRVPLAPAIRAARNKVPRKAADDWTQLAHTIEQLEEAEARRHPDRMIRIVLEAGYEDYLKTQYPNFRSRIEDLEQLGNFALQFNGIEDFLAQLALLTNVEAEANQQTPDDEQLRLSTIHQAKGLEFDVVFVIMLCDGLFPSQRSLENDEDEKGEEEERRLFYVALTRARNELYLCHPIVRPTQGYGDYMQTPSRFLGEIPTDLLDEWNLQTFHAY